MERTPFLRSIINNWLVRLEGVMLSSLPQKRTKTLLKNMNKLFQLFIITYALRKQLGGWHLQSWCHRGVRNDLAQDARCWWLGRNARKWMLVHQS